MRLPRAFFAGLILLPLAVGGGSAVGQGPDEATIKTAFLRNFAEFVHWPEEPEGPFGLCILGRDELGARADTLNGYRLRRMTMQVRRLASERDLSGCHMVYLAEGDTHRFSALRATINGRPVLVVGEHEGLAGLGAAISLMRRPDGRLGFDLNLAAIRASSLEVSSRLISLARRVF